MPAIPSISEIKARIISDIETSFNQKTPSFLISFNRQLAKAISGFILLFYNAILWVYAQIFPDRADYAALVLLGALVKIKPLLAVAAIITADVYGTNGETVLEGTLFTGSNGILYKITAGGIIADGAASCTLVSLVPGDDGNIADDETLSIVGTDLNLTGEATVTGTITEGSDKESEEHFRARVVARYKKRFTGGSPADYELWGLEAPHFIWVSPYTDDTGAVDVVIYGKVDNQTDGIPTTEQLNTLKQYLIYDPETGKRYRKPITDEIECKPISVALFDVEIQIKDGSALLKANIQEAIYNYMAALEPYNEGVSTEKNDAVTNAGISAVAQELAQEEGATILQVVLRETLTGSIRSNYVLYGGEFSKMNSCDFEDVI